MQTPTLAQERLERLLANVPPSPASAAETRAFAGNLSGWILGGRGAGRGLSRQRAARAARLDLLAARLAGEGPGPGLYQFLRGLRQPDSLVRLLAETGIPAEATLWSELSRRMFVHALAIDVDETDLAALCALSRLRPEDGELANTISPAAWEFFARLFAPEDDEVRTAFELVLRRAVAIGLSRAVLRLGAQVVDRDSPFFALGDCGRRLAASPADPEARAEFEASVRRSLAELEGVLDRAQRRGVSTQVLIAVDQARSLLARLFLLARLRAGDSVGRELLADLLRSAGEERSLRALVRSKLGLLSRKMVEHAGDVGSHYIVRRWREYFAMAVSAAWGGAMAAAAALVKLALSMTHLAPGLLGLAYSLNYAACFVVMQLAGFTLASRQPSMTAAALARTLEVSDGVEQEVDMIAGIARAQAIAAAGNILVALPAAIALDALMHELLGRTLLDAAHATHVHETLTIASPSNVLFAALTGVFLWMASMAGGWASNWSVLHSLPTAIAESRPLRRLLGARFAARLGRLARRHFGGVCGYVTLAFLMGFTPLFAGFMGLDLAAPHVTIATASLGFALSAEWHSTGLIASEFALSLAGVVGIGLLNFGVSFALAFALALRAMSIGPRDRHVLLLGLLRAFATNPLRFLIPAGDSRTGSAAAPKNEGSGPDD